MFRQIIKLSQVVPQTHQKLASYGARIQISRQIGGGITANWPDIIRPYLERERIGMPTLIQEKTLPVVMQDKNLIGIARNGSGKTLAFVVPMVMKIYMERKKTNNNGGLATCLVLVPSEKLASQISDEFKKFDSIKSRALLDEFNGKSQLNEPQDNNHDIYVSTPQRLIDLIDKGNVELSNIKYVILDEADKMLDMGLELQIRDAIDRVPKDHQTLMWSSTWSKELQSLATKIMNDHEFVAVGNEHRNQPVKFSTSEAHIDYKATRNFYHRSSDLPSSHNLVLACTGTLAMFYLIFIRDDIDDNQGILNDIKPVHELMPQLAIPMIQAAIVENKRYGQDTKKLEKKLEEYLKEPGKYGGDKPKLIEN